MTITPADVLRWTGKTISAEDCAAFAASAEARLSSDGGVLLPDSIRTQLLCYLIAGMAESAEGAVRILSENIGGYSYSTTAPTSTSKWADLYKEVLSSFRSIGLPKSGIVQHSADSVMVQMDRSFGGF